MRYSDTAFPAPSVPLLLRAARKAARLTQTELARRMGTTQSVISRAESLDGPDPTIAFLKRFAVATGQTLALAVSPSEYRAAGRVEAPTVQAEAPAVRAEAPAVRAEAPAVRAEAPAVRAEAATERAPAATPHEPVVASLRDAKRLRVLARRLGCAWIAVVDPAARHAPASCADGRLHLVVRMGDRSRRGEAMERLRRAAERTFCRATSILDIDSVRPLELRAQVARSRRALSPPRLLPATAFGVQGSSP